MPPPRIVMLISVVAAAVAVLGELVSLTGWLSDAATAIALLAAAGYAVLMVRRPVARWALAAGTVVLAAVPVVGWLLVDDPPPLLVGGDIHRIFRQEAAADHAVVLVLAVAAVAFTVGVAALPQFRRPIWATALACVVALMPVAMVGYDAADPVPPFGPVPTELWWHLAPGFAATVLAGLALVLAVSRADRWFLLPVGALLVQVTIADWTLSSAGSWSASRLYSGVDADAISTFLSPGLRVEMPATTSWTLDWEVQAALEMAAFLVGPMLIALGAARTAGAPATVPGPGEPEQPQEG